MVRILWRVLHVYQGLGTYGNINVNAYFLLQNYEFGKLARVTCEGGWGERQKGILTYSSFVGAGKREFLMSQVRNLRARLQQHRLWEIVRTWVDWMWEDVKKEESRVFLYFFFSLEHLGGRKCHGEMEKEWDRPRLEINFKSHQHKYGSWNHEIGWNQLRKYRRGVSNGCVFVCV